VNNRKKFHIQQEKYKKIILLHQPPISSNEEEAYATSIENSLKKPVCQYEKRIRKNRHSTICTSYNIVKGKI
jgi:hypothetical protein